MSGAGAEQQPQSTALGAGAGAAADDGVRNLPVWLTGLVGRETELGELRALLWHCRLLSLCGPGGVGKTRLAAALAQAVRADLIGGAWWVDLSATSMPQAVGARAAAVVLRDRPASDPIQALVSQLREPALLVLDNCEQVLDACAQLAVALLSRAPALRLLTTSRQPLGVTGEQVWRVGGLPVGCDDAAPGARRAPDAAAPGDGAGSAVESAALALFMERAAQAGSPLERVPESLSAARSICACLDGIPLAIELAAARVPALGVAEVARRLEQGQTELLEQRHPSGPAHHRTLADTLRWSYSLLEADERRLLGRLSCFPGEFSLSSAEAVCCDERLGAARVAASLASLVDRSLVQVVAGGVRQRYRLLGVVRQFAASQPDTDGERQATLRRHARHFQARAAELARADQLADLDSRRELVNLDAENFDAALDWLCDHDAAGAARMASALWPVWYRRGRYAVARRRFDALLERVMELPDDVALRLTIDAGEVAFLQCDYARAAELMVLAEPLCARLGDRAAEVRVRHRQGAIAREQANYPEARALHERALELCAQLGDERGGAVAHSYLGFVAWLAGDSPAAERHCRRALDGLREPGDLQERALALVNLGATALYGGDAQRGGELAAEALELSRRLQFSEGIAWSANVLAVAGRRRGRPLAELADQLREALLVHQQLGDRWRLASVLEEAAGGLLARRDPRLAVALMAAAASLRERLQTPTPPAEKPDLEAAERRLRRLVSSQEHARCRTEGRAMTEEEAAEQALAGLQALSAGDGEVPNGSPAGRVPALTPRERAVLELLAEGQTNREIAAALYISPSTAGVHVSNLLGKLGAKRRVDAAAIAQRMGVLSAGAQGRPASAGQGWQGAPDRARQMPSGHARRTPQGRTRRG